MEQNPRNTTFGPLRSAYFASAGRRVVFTLKLEAFPSRGQFKMALQPADLFFSFIRLCFDFCGICTRTLVIVVWSSKRGS